MSEIAEKQKEIERRIDEMYESQTDRRIVDVSKWPQPNELILRIRIQHSGPAINVYFNARACKVVTEEPGERSREFGGTDDNVVEDVLGYIREIIGS